MVKVGDVVEIPEIQMDLTDVVFLRDPAAPVRLFIDGTPECPDPESPDVVVPPSWVTLVGGSYPVLFRSEIEWYGGTVVELGVPVKFRDWDPGDDFVFVVIESEVEDGFSDHM
jgi:hypothetical protein